MANIHLPPTKTLLLSFLIAGVVVLAAAPSYYFFIKYQKSQLLLKNPTEAAKQEIQALVARVGKLMELPVQEPTVATISDKEKLKDQAFFAKSENGDKVLIYTQDRKAILYRPSTNKIIEVSVVNLGEAALASPSAQVPSTVRVAIYNGTNTVGLTAKAESQLKAKIANIDVVSRENAKKRDYTKTVVVVLNPGASQEAQTVAQLLGGTVGTLPEGEARPNADIAVIVGK